MSHGDPLQTNTKRIARAQKLVENQCVKMHLFVPSGRKVWTVVGVQGDSLVDVDEKEIRQYCSCDDFHYRVLSGKVPECYHLIAARRAIAEGQYAEIEFSDEEFEPFLHALVRDLFSHF